VKPAPFFSTFMYTACKAHGVTGAELLKYETRAGVESLELSQWPGFRTLARLAQLFVGDAFPAYVDGSTYITRARCLAAAAFLRGMGKDRDVWLTCDDDVYADGVVQAQLLDVARATRGIVALPYLNRDGGSMTFRKVTGPTVWVESCPIRAVDRVGMGLVAMHREAIETIDRAVPHFEDDVPAMFLEGVCEVDPDTGKGMWTGDDYWLCMLAERHDIPLHVLLDAPGEHAGLRAKLDLDGRICLDDDGVAARLQESLRAKELARSKLLASLPVNESPTKSGRRQV
jgi:hypothetical protein